MKRVAWLILLAVLIGAAEGSFAASADARWRSGVERVLKRAGANEAISLLVVDTRTGAVWYERAPDALRKPASVLKLLVTAVALERLGPGFHFETQLLRRGDELWVYGSGDPALLDARLNERRSQPVTSFLDRWAADAWRAQAYTRFVVDDFVFDRVQRHPDWDPRQAARWYQAPLSGLNLATNCLEFELTVRGAELLLTPDPRLPARFYENQLRAGSKHRPVVLRPVDQDRAIVRGTATRSDRLGPVAMRDATLFAAHALRSELVERGVKVEPNVVRRRLTPDALRQAELLGVARTSLSEVLWRANAFSMNLHSEALLKAVEAYGASGERTGTSGSAAGGFDVVRSITQQAGIDLTDAELRDGSGLSHQNRMSARQIVGVLRWMARSRHKEAFYTSLATPGTPGATLRRYPGSLVGKLRAKTGTLRGVRALAGYVERPDGTQLAFCFFHEGRLRHDLRQDLAQALCR